MKDEAAPRSIMIQPFAMLPMLYCLSFLFRSELKAILSLLGYSFFAQWILPYMIVFSRVPPPQQRDGDGLFKMAKILPMSGPGLSMMFNTDILEALDIFRR